MAEEEVKLLGSWGSPFSCRVQLALNLKSVPYEFIQEDIFNKSPRLLELNPVHKKIPVLLHNGKPLAESLIIIEYLDETWKDHPILPSQPYDRAAARFWTNYIDEEVMPALWKARSSSPEEQEGAVAAAQECLKTLENELGDKRFFGGDNIGFVDIAANFVGFWLGVAEEAFGVQVLTAEKFPRMQKWIEEFRSHEVVKKTLPPKERLLSVFRAMHFQSYANNLAK